MEELGKNTHGHCEMQSDFYWDTKKTRNDLSTDSYPNAQFQHDFAYGSEIRARSGSGSSSSSSSFWCFSDPELKRKKRVASYKAIAIEGKVKGSFRKSFNWVKVRWLRRWF